MNTIYNRADPQASQHVIDLHRDMEMLMMALKPSERTNFAQHTKLLFAAGQTHFESKDRFLAAMQAVSPLYSPSQKPPYFDRLLKHIASLDKITQIDDALFYDFTPSNHSGQDATMIGFDFYINTTPHTPKEAQTERILKTMAPDTSDALYASRRMYAFNQEESFDFKDIPFETLFGEDTPAYIRDTIDTQDALYIMSCLEGYSSQEIQHIIQSVIDMHTIDESKLINNPFRDNRKEVILATFGLIDELHQQIQPSADEVIALAEKARVMYNRSYYDDIRSQVFLEKTHELTNTYPFVEDEEGEIVKAPERLIHEGHMDQLREDVFYDDLAAHLERADKITKALLPFSGHAQKVDLGSILLDFHYMTPDNLVSVIQKLSTIDRNIIKTLPTLSGLSYSNIDRILNHAGNTDFQLGRDNGNGQNVVHVYQSYCHETQGAFAQHEATASEIIARHADEIGDYIDNPTMILAVVASESEGDNTKVNKATKQYGLMQINYGAYQELCRRNLIRPELKQIINRSNFTDMVTGHKEIELANGETTTAEKINMEIGILYLYRCMRDFNPTGSLAVALGNYNWGNAAMVRHRAPYYYSLSDNQPELTNETENYIAKYLIYNRMFEDQQYSADLINKEKNKDDALSEK